MTESKIVQKGDVRLRKPSRPLEMTEVNSRKVQQCIQRMHETLAGEVDGVALAAPQIGENLRIFVISPKVFESKATGESLVYINPVITRRSRKKVNCDEGCLSVRNIYGRIERHEKVNVSALDQKGGAFSRGGSGLLAEIFQHEIDHLDGKLFVDTATELRRVETLKQ